MKLPSEIKFIDEKLKKTFASLEQGRDDEKQLYKLLTRAFKDIREDAFCGVQIPKKLIPKEYLKKRKVNNLWKYNLPDAWRLLYSIENNNILVMSIVLEWMGHKEYEKRFKY